MITSELISFIAVLVFFSPPGMAPTPRQRQVRANGVTIGYESLGNTDRETIVLIAGTRMRITDWPAKFCENLVKHGYRVVIYDNRDVGLSTKFDSAGMLDFTERVLSLTPVVATDGKPRRSNLNMQSWRAVGSDWSVIGATQS
jgi:pimeloyl-ACP methyl ester carboxylesterase